MHFYILIIFVKNKLKLLLNLYYILYSTFQSELYYVSE